MANSADPDQLASIEANLSGSFLFVKRGHVVFSKRRVKGWGLRGGNLWNCLAPFLGSNFFSFRVGPLGRDIVY